MESFNFTFKEFNENSCSTIRNLFEDKQFSDVTILSEEGEEMKLHRVILASASTFFRNILSRIKQNNPLIFLKGIQMKELQFIVQFMYLGHTEVPQEGLKLFMEAAKSLQISGLSENFQTLSASGGGGASPDKPTPSIKRVHFSLEKNQNIIFEQTELNDNFIDYTEELDQQVEVCVDHMTEKDVSNYKDITNIKQNGQQNKPDTKIVKYSCDSCDQMYNRQDNLLRHLKLAHGQLLL